jgi:hypothetical protein
VNDEAASDSIPLISVNRLIDDDHKKGKKRFKNMWSSKLELLENFLIHLNHAAQEPMAVNVKVLR